MAIRDEIARIDARAERLASASGVVWRRWGNGPPVILVHGGSGSWMHWIRNVEHLARRFSVWAVDLPGCGESAAGPAGMDFFGQASLMADSWREVGGSAAPIRLVGFSVGASVAAAFAGPMGAAIDRLILIGGCYAGPHPRPRMPLLDHRGVTDRAALDDIHRRNLQNMMVADPDRADDLAVFIQSHNIANDRFERRQLSAPEAMRRALPQVEAPVGGIWGEHDPLAVPEVQISGLIALQPSASTHVLPGLGHWAIYEGPETLNALLDDVLS